MATGSATGASWTGWFSMTAHGAQRRIHNRRVVIGGKCKVDQSKEILQNLRISLHTSLPIFIDAPFQLGLSIFDLLRMRWSVIMIPGMSCDTVEMIRMCRLSSVCE